MSETGDRLKSMLRATLERASTQAAKMPALARARAMLEDIKHMGAALPMESVRAQLLQVPSITSLSVELTEAGANIDASFDDAEDFAACIKPVAVSFAPRGAKEITFACYPPEASRHKHASDCVAAIATAIGRTLWAALMKEQKAAGGFAIVDREGTDHFRVDLRTLPALRDMRGGAASGLLLDALALTSIECSAGTMRLVIRPPTMF